MKIIKLKLKDYDEDIHFGLPNEHKTSNVEKKLNRGLALVKPWLYCIPYYDDSSVAFLSKDAILTFLYDICEFEKEEIIELNNIGYYIEYYKVSLVDTGFSKIICTFKMDEVKDGPKQDSILKYARKQNFKHLSFFENVINTKDSNRIKNTYYNNIKSNF